MTEPYFRKIIASLWAFVGWTNKDYVADRVLTYKDIKELRSELKELLYGKAPFPQRYDVSSPYRYSSIWSTAQSGTSFRESFKPL